MERAYLKTKKSKKVKNKESKLFAKSVRIGTGISIRSFSFFKLSSSPDNIGSTAIDKHPLKPK